MQIVRVKLCFLLDCTGSMGPWIRAAKEQIEVIVEKTQREYASADLRFQVAFVGYRDYGDEVPHEVILFTNVEEFLSKMRGVQAVGGDDLAEDVAGGIQRVLHLPWEDSDVRTVIHIADAPPHGTAYHAPHISDRFPDGDPQGIDLNALLREMAHTIDMTFIGMNRSTDLYIEAALSAYREVQKRTFTVADLRPQDTRFLTPIAMRTVSDSIQRYTASQDPSTE
jgi:hypothetical protein